MDDDREPYEPLWAESLRREPSPKPEAAARPKKLPSFRAGLALAIVALVAFAALGATDSDDSGGVTFADLPSYWGSVEMRCATVRIERNDRTWTKST